MSVQWLWKFNPGIFILFGFLVLWSCKSNTHKKQDGGLQLPNDFVEFYEAFHNDSLFQMSHINFPLKGLPDGADPEEKNYDDFYYTADQWIMHRKFDPKLYASQFHLLADILIEERITEKKYQLMMIRRFAKGSSGWSLIYYAGLNKWTGKEGG